MSHWYSIKDGSPRYTVPYANGKGERATNLGDARKLGLVPSVTTLLGIINKDALTRWKINEVLEAAIEHPYDEIYNDASQHWKSTIIRMSEKKGKDAAERGGLIHDALEQYYLGRGLQPDFEDYCRPAIDLIAKRFGKMANWIPEASFSHKLGFGGKCDLHMQPCGDFPNGVIIDFKTKSAEDFSKVKAYPEQCQQLVAYREGFGLPNAECYNLFISTKEPGQLMLHQWGEEECEKAWRCFLHLVGYWQISNNFEVSLDK